MPFCTSRLPLTIHQAGTSPSFPSLSEGFFSFCFSGAPDLTSESWFPLAVEFVSLSGPDLAAGRCLLRDGGWKWRSEITGSSLQKQHRGYWSQPEPAANTAGWYPAQQGHSFLPGQLLESPSTSGTESNSGVTAASLQVRWIAVNLCLRHSEGPASSVRYGTREILGWVLWRAKWTTSFSKELRIQTRPVIGKERTQCRECHLAKQAKA